MKKSLLLLFILIGGLVAFSQKKTVQPKTAEERLNATYCSGLFSTAEGTYFDLLDNIPITGYINILDWLQGRVAGLQVFTTNTGVRVPYIRNQWAAVYVDEIRREVDFLNVLPVTDIAMIKIIKGPFLGSFGAAGGTIAIYTIGTGDEGAD